MKSKRKNRPMIFVAVILVMVGLLCGSVPVLSEELPVDDGAYTSSSGGIVSSSDASDPSAGGAQSTASTPTASGSGDTSDTSDTSETGDSGTDSSTADGGSSVSLPEDGGTADGNASGGLLEKDPEDDGASALIDSVMSAISPFLADPLPGPALEVRLDDDTGVTITSAGGGLVNVVHAGGTEAGVDPAQTHIHVNGQVGSQLISVDGVSVTLVLSGSTASGVLISNGGSATIVLDGINTLASGILQDETSHMTIDCLTEDAADVLNAGGPTATSAVIGGMQGQGFGTINILGGTLNLPGRDNVGGAAIGGGTNDNGGTINIRGGVINATSKQWGAVIGGGFESQPQSVRSINIYGGVLNLESNFYGACIGGGQGTDGGNILIEGGTFNLKSTYRGAGIGGGVGGSGGTIKITGGTFDIKCPNNSAAIGGGGGDGGWGPGAGGSIEITGGIFDLKTQNGAGIGSGGIGSQSGSGSDGGTIVIRGGTIRATTTYNGAGIGGGDRGDGGSITIYGGEIDAVGENGAGIGGGVRGAGGNVTIHDGIIHAQSKQTGAGIGSGLNDALNTPPQLGGTLSILGGNVTAIGGQGIGAGISVSYQETYSGTVLTVNQEATVVAYGRVGYAICAENDTNKGTAKLQNNYFETAPSPANSLPVAAADVDAGGGGSAVADRSLSLPAGFRAFGYTAGQATGAHTTQEAAQRFIVRASDNEFYIPHQTGAAAPVEVVFGAVYSVTYAPGQAGSAATGMPGAEDVLVNQSHTVSTQQPAWSGYRFTGWQKQPGGQVYAAGQSASFVVTANATLTAQWEAIPNYTVSYRNASGVQGVSGMPVPSAVQVQQGQTFTVSAAVPRREGYSFGGWQYESTSTVYQAGQAFAVPGRNVVLTSTWLPNSYLVTFDYAGARSNTYANVDHGSTIPKPDDPTMTGYTFGGWDYEGELWDFSRLIPGKDVTLVARWTPVASNIFTVTYDYADGVRTPVTRQVQQGTLVPSQGSPARDGYQFTGWFTGGQAWSFDTMLMPAHDLTLTAGWSPIQAPEPPSEVSSSTVSSSSSSRAVVVSSASSSDAGASSGGEGPASSGPAALPADPAPADPLPPSGGDGVAEAAALPADPVQQRVQAQTGNPITDIFQGNVPLGGITYSEYWSLLNLMLALAGVIATIVLLVHWVAVQRRRVTGRKSKVCTLVAGLLGPLGGILFLALENVANPYVFINRWTPLMAVVFVGQLVFLVLRALSRRREEEEEDAEYVE